MCGPCMDKTWWPAGQKESHNNSGICAKEQEELSVCCLRYPLFLLFVQEWSLVPAARKPVISAPEQANNTISKSRDGQTSPTHLLLTGSSHDFIGSLYPSIHPLVSALDKMEGCVICYLNQPSNREGSESQGKLDIAGHTNVFLMCLIRGKLL